MKDGGQLTSGQMAMIESALWSTPEKRERVEAMDKEEKDFAVLPRKAEIGHERRFRS